MDGATRAPAATIAIGVGALAEQGLASVGKGEAVWFLRPGLVVSKASAHACDAVALEQRYVYICVLGVLSVSLVRLGELLCRLQGRGVLCGVHPGEPCPL